MSFGPLSPCFLDSKHEAVSNNTSALTTTVKPSSDISIKPVKTSFFGKVMDVVWHLNPEPLIIYISTLIGGYCPEIATPAGADVAVVDAEVARRQANADDFAVSLKAVRQAIDGAGLKEVTWGLAAEEEAIDGAGLKEVTWGLAAEEEAIDDAGFKDVTWSWPPYNHVI